MPEIQYSIDAKISNYEWFLIQEHRKLVQHGGGELNETIVDGIGVGLKVSFTQKRDNLLKLQTQTL
jgi:hypothetical protein